MQGLTTTATHLSSTVETSATWGPELSVTKSAYDKYLHGVVRADARTQTVKRVIGQRDGMGCFCCGCYYGHRINVRHHIKPVAKGGERWRQNLVTLCPTCHALVHDLNRSARWCSVYQLRDSILFFRGMTFGRAFKLALIATEEVVIEDDRTIWPRTIHRVRETLVHTELNDLLFVSDYWKTEVQKWENA